MTLPYEPVLVQRTSTTLQGLIDPHEHKLYLSLGVDVQAGDTVGFRGYTRRIVKMPDVWHLAGVVAEFEDAPTYLPDLGQLLRNTGRGPVNEDTGDWTSATTETLFSGPCLVERAESDGSNPEIGDQTVGVVPFVVTLPLTVVDVKPGDLFRVTSSRDGRLLVRSLVVKAVRASSTDLTRELLAFDNQGG